MTASQQVVPVDAGNQLLGGGPAQLTTSEAATPAGRMTAVTVRTASTTVTVFLARDDVQAWATALQGAADAMGGLTVIRGTQGVAV